MQRSIDWEALATVRRLAYQNTRRCSDAVALSSHSFFHALQLLPEDQRALSVTDCALPCILHSSIRVLYDENPSEDVEEWCYLSDNRAYDEVFEKLMNSIGRCHVDAQRIPQYREHGGYLFNGKKKPATLPVGSRVAVRFQVQNPLDEEVVCEKVRLLTSAETSVEHTATEFVLKPCEVKEVCVVTRLVKEGEVEITGVSFTLHAPNDTHTLRVDQSLHPRGLRLNQTAEQRRQRVYGEENCLCLRVEPNRLRARCVLESVPPSFFSELVALPLTIENRGTSPLTSVFLFTDNYHWFVEQRDRQAVIALTNNLQHSPSLDFAQVYALLKPGEALQPGATLSVASYLHLPEGNGCGFLREEGSRVLYSLRCVLLLGGEGSEWRLVRVKRDIEVKPLLSTECSVILDNQDVLFFKAVAENVAEEEIEEITVFPKSGRLCVAVLLVSVLSYCAGGASITDGCVSGNNERDDRGHRAAFTPRWEEHVRARSLGSAVCALHGFHRALQHTGDAIVSNEWEVDACV